MECASKNNNETEDDGNLGGKPCQAAIDKSVWSQHISTCTVIRVLSGRCIGPSVPSSMVVSETCRLGLAWTRSLGVSSFLVNDAFTSKFRSLLSTKGTYRPGDSRENMCVVSDEKEK
ncbi:hypothetical protein RRG08_060117 [Elysia crispata]|uniref:Uncharacterized protein n=1 Tax=Elysia crispata TaxID=231223 RepID=A0AAE1EDW0_9GAST|nr:hypothetical protein RRG08_060117 [Elysia crispata]